MTHLSCSVPKMAARWEAIVKREGGGERKEGKVGG